MRKNDLTETKHLIQVSDTPKRKAQTRDPTDPEK